MNISYFQFWEFFVSFRYDEERKEKQKLGGKKEKLERRFDRKKEQKRRKER